MRSLGTSVPLGAATARVRSELSPQVNVPLFRSLIERLEQRQPEAVLDLGAARPRTIAMFSRFRCRLDIADLADSLGVLGNPDESSRRGELEALLPASGGPLADVVLAWDFFNYLDRPGLEALAARIAERCRGGAIVHALICYSDALMPPRPGRFVPAGDGQFLDSADNPPSRPAPRYTPEDLRQIMPAYHVERACLLRNGMQEYLFSIAKWNPDALSSGPRSGAHHLRRRPGFRRT